MYSKRAGSAPNKKEKDEQMIVKSFFLSGFCLGQWALQRFSLATRLIGCSFACCLVWLLASCTAMQPAPVDNPPVAAAVQIAPSPTAIPSPEEDAMATGQRAAEMPVDDPVNDQEPGDAIEDQPEPTEPTSGADANIDLEPEVTENGGDNEPTSAAPPTVAVVVPIPTPTPTPVAPPLARALNALNVRAGPGTDYAVVSGLEPSAQVEITGRNADADWWQILLPGGGEGWVYAPLIETTASATVVALAAAIPERPSPTPVPEPVVAVETAPAQPEAAPEPVEEDAALEEPAPEAEEPAPPAGGPDFRVIEKRLWDVVENGGVLDGNSVRCGERRQLQVIVVDANGVRLSGIPVQVQYGAKEVIVTGTHGEGAAEFVLGHGQDVAVVRDVDGRAVTSEVATGLVTVPWEIPYEHLIAGRFCTDDASCASFVNATGCYGHYSWTVIFQRSY
jgi:uncharacterized protein YraI